MCDWLFKERNIGKNIIVRKIGLILWNKEQQSRTKWVGGTFDKKVHAAMKDSSSLLVTVFVYFELKERTTKCARRNFLQSTLCLFNVERLPSSIFVFCAALTRTYETCNYALEITIILCPAFNDHISIIR